MAKFFGTNTATSVGNSLTDGGRRNLGRMFTDSLQKWRQNRMAAAEEKRRQDPRYQASELASQPGVSRGSYEAESQAQMDAIKNSPYLAEFMKARKLAQQRVEGAFGAAQKEGDINLKRFLAAQGGAGGGHALRLQQEQTAELMKQKEGAMQEAVGQIDVAEAQDRTRRMERAEELGIQKYEFDSNLNFQERTLGHQMQLNWGNLDLQMRTEMVNLMTTLKEMKFKPKDIERMRPIFESMRVDQPGQALPGTEFATTRGTLNQPVAGQFFQGQTPGRYTPIPGGSNQLYRP